MVFSKKMGLAALTAMLFSVNVNAADFKLDSPDIKDGEQLSLKQVANSFGCKGQNMSPALEWTEPPAGTKSFAVTVYDPDAPTGSGWWHWTVYNIPAKVRGLEGNAAGNGKLPKEAIQVRNDGGKKEFMGACPPQGDQPHHYIVTLYALNTDSLELPSDASSAMAGFMINKAAIAKSVITGIYSRN